MRLSKTSQFLEEIKHFQSSQSSFFNENQRIFKINTMKKLNFMKKRSKTFDKKCRKRIKPTWSEFKTKKMYGSRNLTKNGRHSRKQNNNLTEKIRNQKRNCAFYKKNSLVLNKKREKWSLIIKTIFSRMKVRSKISIQVLGKHSITAMLKLSK